MRERMRVRLPAGLRPLSEGVGGPGLRLPGSHAAVCGGLWIWRGRDRVSERSDRIAVAIVLHPPHSFLA